MRTMLVIAAAVAVAGCQGNNSLELERCARALDLQAQALERADRVQQNERTMAETRQASGDAAAVAHRWREEVCRGVTR